MRKYLILALALFVLLDFGHSSFKFFQQAMYGDLIPLVLPNENSKPVLSDPFGFKALQKKEYHSNINRFFSAVSLYSYMRTMPFVFQKVVDPVQSLYWSSAMLKIFIHLGFILLLAKIVSPKKMTLFDWLLLFFIITPFMIIGTKLGAIQLIDFSTVYVFFYGLPFVIFLVFCLPFIKMIKAKDADLYLKKWEWVGLFGLMILLSFSSAIMSPTVLLGGGLFLLYQFLNKSGGLAERLKLMPKNVMIVLGSFMLLCLYSFYVGTFNSESAIKPALSIRYSALAAGAKNIFLHNLGTQLLWGTIFLNFFLLRHQKITVWNRSFGSFLFPILIFSAIYILLLPLGGYRNYRPDILRNDMLIPITISAIFLVTLSTFYLMKMWKNKGLKLYIVFFITIVAIYSHYDYGTMPRGKKCEMAALYKISEAEEGPVRIEGKCNVVGWASTSDPNFYADHARLFKFWNINEKELLFYVDQKKK